LLSSGIYAPLLLIKSCFTTFSKSDFTLSDTEKARKELEERLEKRKAEKKETEERLEKQRAEKQEQEERQYNLKIDGKDVTDLTGKMVELLGTSTSIGVMENGVSTFDVLA
jgi:ribosomal protein S4